MPVDIPTASLHILASIILFFLINWVGRHAVDFGYSSTSLFDDGEESIALNLFVKALLPAVYVVTLSAAAVAIGMPDLRLGITFVVYFYFLIRLLAIIALDRVRLVSWYKFIIHAGIGISLAQIAYVHLILPNKSLLPNLETVGNELWLAIFAFLYAIANKVPLPGEPAARRKNTFVRGKYLDFRDRYGGLIETVAQDKPLQLIIYAIAIAEDYARPSFVRSLERYLPWRDTKTTGLMQVKSRKILSDYESVSIAAEQLSEAWAKAKEFDEGWELFSAVVASHNRDDDYIWKVWEIARLIAKRADRSFEPALKAF